MEHIEHIILIRLKNHHLTVNYQHMISCFKNHMVQKLTDIIYHFFPNEYLRNKLYPISDSVIIQHFNSVE